MTFRRPRAGAQRLATIGVFACAINGLASGCHKSLDLLVDKVDAAVTTPPDSGAGDASDAGRPALPSPVRPDSCVADPDCASVGGVCAVEKGICVECTSDDQCSGQRQCDERSNRCVGCVSADDCRGRTCDALTQECAIACSSNDDCLVPAFSICSEARHVCVMCETDSDCSGFSLFSPFPLQCRMGTCRECVIDEDCPTERPFCSSLIGICEECRTAAQCPLGSACVSRVPNIEIFRQCQ